MLGNGNVGIGTSTPSKKLEINGAGGNAIRITNNGMYAWDNSVLTDGTYRIANTGNGSFIFSSYSSLTLGTASGVGTGSLFSGSGYFANNVGIGTTTPGYALAVVGTTSANQLVLSTAGDSATQGTIKFLGSSYASGLSFAGNGDGVRLHGRNGADFLEVTSGATKFSGVITANAGDNGSAASPVYTFQSSTGTGMWRPAADVLGFSTAGNERLRIDSSGNVGIGTTSPQALLHVFSSTAVVTPIIESSLNGGYYNAALNIKSSNGRAGGVLFNNGNDTNTWFAGRFYGDNTNNGWGIAYGDNSGFALPQVTATSTKFYVSGAGNVGVGTTTPGYALTVGSGSLSVPLGSAGTPGLILGGNTNNGIFSDGASVSIKANGASGFTYNGAALFTTRMYASTAGTAAAPTYSFGAPYTTGFYYPSAGAIGFSASGTEAIRISAAGNIGIGTTTPISKLAVVGDL